MQEMQVQSQFKVLKVFGSVSTSCETLGGASQVKNARNYFQPSPPCQWKHMCHAELRQTQSPWLLIISLLTTATLFPMPSLTIQSHLLFHVPWKMWIAWPTDLEGKPMPLTHMGSLRSESCMRIQSMLISILFVAPFSDGSSTKFKSMG